MMGNAMRPQVTLRFKDQRAFTLMSDPVHEDLSAAARVGRSLFLACDETAGVDRLSPLADGSWGDHVHINLGEMFDLPGGPCGEMDIEGLAVDDGWLWMVGSHALKRGRPKREANSARAALERMREVDRDPNRFFLGRVPLRDDGHGVLTPVMTTRARQAQAVRLTRTKSQLQRWLADEPLLVPSFEIPSKENGFDVEGLAARGDRIWLGLRGPVLRGHAVVVELRLEVDAEGRLEARVIEDGRRYRLHLIASQGLGIRDLLVDGPDMLALLGPTMSADGPARVLRWREALRDTKGGVVAADRLQVVEELPYRGAVDHPEGLELWPEAGTRGCLVVYDAPAPQRLDQKTWSVKADIIQLPPR